MADEKTFSLGVNIDQVTTMVMQQVQAAADKAAVMPKPEQAEPYGWWDLWAYGPFQVSGIGGPLLPHKVIKVGEPFYVATVLWLNPSVILPGGVTASQLISNLACDFRVQYCTADMCRVTRSAQFSRDAVKVQMKANQNFYVDVQRFDAVAGTESCVYEMNICARITGCNPDAAPPLAGFATAVYEFDADLILGTTPGLRESPLRFQVY